jgi:hypothetical protein
MDLHQKQYHQLDHNHKQDDGTELELYQKQFELRAKDPEEAALMEDGVSDVWLWSVHIDIV